MKLLAKNVVSPNKVSAADPPLVAPVNFLKIEKCSDPMIVGLANDHICTMYPVYTGPTVCTCVIYYGQEILA